MSSNSDLFNKLKNDLLNLDPVSWVERHLTLDGKKFRLNNNGYRPFADIYRYIGIKALEPNAKPVILVKGRQVGGTTMAGALEMYFMGSGIFGVGDKPPIRVIHAFPQLELAAAYSKTKLNQMISSSILINDSNNSSENKKTKPKSYMQNLLDQSSATNDSLHFKQFIGGNHVWIESTGLDADRIMGRQLSLETELPTTEGFVKLKDLTEHNRLFDEKGNICNIVKLHPIDLTPESYRITFDDGSTVDACADHLWLTCTKHNRIILNKLLKGKTDHETKITIKSTKEILKTLRVSTSTENNHSIPNCLPLNYPERELPVDPYLLGSWLAESEFYDKDIPQLYMCSSFKQRLALVQGLLDVVGYFGRGKRTVLFIETREKLANQVYELILSLGIKAYLEKKEKIGIKGKRRTEYIVYFTTNLPVFTLEKKLAKLKNDNNCIIKCTHRFITKVEPIDPIPMRCITVDSESRLFLITRKCIPTHNTADVIFFDECMIFTQKIDTIDGNQSIGSLYKKFTKGLKTPLIKTFNETTQSFEYKKIINAWSRGKKPLIELIISGKKITCTENHKFLTLNGWLQANQLKIGTLIKSSIDKYQNWGFSVVQSINKVAQEKNVYDLEIEDNHNFVLSPGGVIAHNCQKTTGQAIGNALKILTTAKYGKPSKGVQVFFGTPRRKGSDFHKMWMSSTQQYYYLGCEKCEKHFPLYTPNSDDWEKVWLHGYIVKCSHCGFEQDKREAAERGKWIAIKSETDEDCKMIGFHINQLYMPSFTKEDLINEKPGNHPINTERVYKNEVMGEFYQGDAAPISPEEIREHCGEVGRKFRAKIEPSKDQIVVMGIDYGARSDLEQLANPDKAKLTGQSYSTAVILLVKGPALLSIEFATKFKRNDMESKKGLIDQLMRQYSVQLAIGDIGFSQDFSTMLHSSYGDRYLVSRAHNKVNNHIKFSIDAYPKELVFERDHYIAELYEYMKKGNIKFPFGDYEKIAWLIEHCSSMEIKPSISKFGDHSVHYVKGGTPNDGFMALLNAYLAYKFILTKGFTNNNPLLQHQNFKDKNKPLAVVGHIFRRL